MLLTVRIPNGKTVSVEVELSTTIRQMCNLIYTEMHRREMAECPSSGEQIVLIFMGRIADLNATCGELELQRHNSMQCVFRLEPTAPET